MFFFAFLAAVLLWVRNASSAYQCDCDCGHAGLIVTVHTCLIPLLSLHEKGRVVEMEALPHQAWLWVHEKGSVVEMEALPHQA